MTQDDLKLVLEALKWCHGGEPCGTAEAIAVVKKALAQEQEPVAYINVEERKLEWAKPMSWNTPTTVKLERIPLYTHSQRTWAGLTGEEAMDVTRKEGHELLDFIYEYGTGVEGVEERIVAICKAIEAKLKEKNA
jgi:hypothetical protein